MGARGVYNLVTGNDLSDGMMSWVLAGAAGNVGHKTFKNQHLAGSVASALKRSAEAKTAMVPLIEKAKGLTGIARQRVAAKEIAPHGSAYAKAGRELNQAAASMGLARTGVRTNKAAAPKLATPSAPAANAGAPQAAAASAAPKRGSSRAKKTTTRMQANSPFNLGAVARNIASYPSVQAMAGMAQGAARLPGRALRGVDNAIARTGDAIVSRTRFGIPMHYGMPNGSPLGKAGAVAKARQQRGQAVLDQMGANGIAITGKFSKEFSHKFGAFAR
jgi:hypothetical protein